MKAHAPHHAITASYAIHTVRMFLNLTCCGRMHAKKDAAKKLSDLIAVAVSTEHVITHMGV